MSAPSMAFQYVVLRCVPRVDREEFISRPFGRTGLPNLPVDSPRTTRSKQPVAPASGGVTTTAPQLAALGPSGSS